MDEERMEYYNFINSLTQDGVSKKNLIRRSRMTSGRSYGNYNDCFDDGLTSKDAEIALEARELLEKYGYTFPI